MLSGPLVLSTCRGGLCIGAVLLVVVCVHKYNEGEQCGYGWDDIIVGRFVRS